MRIVAYSDSGEELWGRDGCHGYTSRSYGMDGTLAKIVLALENALSQAKGELAVALDVAKPVSYVSGAPT
jgi:hypothetical protein